MPALMSRSFAVVGTAVVASLLLLGDPAAADNRIGGGAKGATPTGGSSTSDGTLSATAGGVVYDRSKNGTGNSTGPVTAVGNWTPPACWYAPKYSPAQFKAYVEPIWNAESTGYEWDNQQRDKYVNGKPYTNFNLDKADKGYWWDSYVNPSYPPGWDTCNKPYFWVDKGAPPPADAPEAITPEVLAKLAYAEIRVPSTKVTLKPDGTTKVNLPTWAWLDKTDFHPVSVTASVPVLNISATTTATPISLKLEPGTGDATVFPATGECPINADGSIGTPYEAGNADKTPPCGVTYLRATSTTPYTLKATVTWKIHWTGTGTPGGNLPDGTFGQDQQVTVQEIQAINR
ncbi:hypothetical protein [Streptomyces sp. CB01201]|uniref:hypothetical protein n=1 Tax=Streptomyces sp. CB01201 TaxID=2020324 RepID=UPI001F46264C|nr:hypothetical protein [Streptomyces sp. CB01201]